jgi:internalin A
MLRIHINKEWNRNNRKYRSKTSLFLSCLCAIILIFNVLQPQSVIAAESTSKGELHAFYPSTAVFSEQMKKYIDQLDSISFAWSRIDAKSYDELNTVKGKNGNQGFYYPTDFIQPVEYAKSQGKSIQLNVYMDAIDGIELLPDTDKTTAMIKAITDTMQAEIAPGTGIYYDGVVIDFEGLRNTDSSKNPIYYNGKFISAYYSQFLKDLKAQFDTMGKKLYVAVNPAVYYDGINFSDVLEIADRVIVMAHDYEPTGKLLKNEVSQYTGYNALEPISSLAPIQMIRQALVDMENAAADDSQLAKVWLQISFDTAQWQFDLKASKTWEKLPGTTQSIKNRIAPLYQSIKTRVDNTDGYGKNISYGYNNELQSPYIQYYNSNDQTWNVILYEDETSISAKIELAKAFHLGGISLWSLGNVPDYSDVTGQKYHLDGWDTIILKMDTYDTLPVGSSKYVTFTDKAVEQAVRTKLNKVSGKISVAEIQSIYRLQLTNGVKSLKDMSKFTNLEYLEAAQLGLKDLTGIANLTNLRVLYLQRNLLTDVSALKNLSKLELLSLNGNQLGSISGLSGLKNLQELYLRENKISSITALSKLTKLKILEAGQNKIAKVDSLKSLKKLENLALDQNQIKDITSLKALTNLTYINLANNQIIGVKSLQPLVGLTTLYLQRNTISDISSLAKLSKLKLLSLNGNRISNLKPLAKLTSLEKLYLKDNNIKSVWYLKGLDNLNELYLLGNNITDYSPVETIYLKNALLCDFQVN